MNRTRRIVPFVRSNALSACCLAAALLLTAVAGPARAQDMMQLDVPKSQYTLGGFQYSPPQADGWRQIANMQSSLSLVYAERKSEETIETRFGVVFEAHDIPAETKVEGAAALAELSRTQMAEARKPDLVGLSPIEAVASVENLYTYRLLVHSPIQGDPDVYEVYYVMMSPDSKQYVVVQCITKTADYANELYFTQFYGSLATLKYKGGAAADKPAEAPANDAAKAAAPAKPADAAKPASKAADAAKPAAH